MKKKILFCIPLIFLFFSTARAQVGINTESPDASAYLDVSGVEKGFLPPRMTEVQRDQISKPATGLVIYNLTAQELQYNHGTPDLPDWLSVGGNSNSGTSSGGANWFYMPVTVLDMTKDAPLTVDLYAEYARQFGLANNTNISGEMSNKPKVYSKGEIEFYILAYDPNAFASATITKEGVLTYTAKPRNVTKASYLNIIIKIK